MTGSGKRRNETATVDQPGSVRVIGPHHMAQHLDSRAKRSVDIALGMIGLTLTIAIFPFIAILIKLTSRGPILYRQDRVGKSQSVFTLNKFRSMYNNSEAGTGPIWASESDERITPIGKFLRLSYLDEFPQFWNVVRGDMSIVGPRPERPEIISVLREDIPEFDKRVACKPGITGLAQINQGYGNTIRDTRYKLRYDLIYIGVASFTMDLKIVLKTIFLSITRAGT